MTALTSRVARRTLAARPRLLFGRPDDRLLALLLLGISATGSLGSISFWIAGNGHLGIRILCGSILLILGLLIV